MVFRKGQAALDFLMTYGWAIALVVIIAAVLFALGVFDVGNFVGNKAAGFSQIAVSGWQLTPAGVMQLKLSNQAGVPVTINTVNITIGANSSFITSGASLPTGSSATVTTATSFPAQAAGTSYTAKVVINYTDNNAGFNYMTSGTLTGKAA